MNWIETLDRDIERTKDSLARSNRLIFATLVAMTSIGVFIIGIIEENELTLSDFPSIAPWWVGIQMLSLSIGVMYAVYMRERLPLIREIAKKGNWPLMTPVDILKAATYLLMGIALVVAAWDRRETWMILVFVPSALIFFASASLIFSEDRMRQIARQSVGRAPRIRNLVKKAKVDMKKFTTGLIITGSVYFGIGLLYLALSWDGGLWSTAVPLSSAAAALLALMKRNFNEYGLSISMEGRLVALEGLRVDILTTDLSEEGVRTRYRTLNGIRDGG